MEVWRIAAVPLFADLEQPQLEAIAAAATPVDAEEGQAIATEGDFGHALYVIESGTAAVSVGDEQRRELGPGDVFGEIAVVASGRRTASIVATSPLRLIALFKRDVWALDRGAPTAAARLRGLIASRNAQRP